MVNREELSVLVERRILATLRQLDEPHSCLAYWARELPVHTPSAEYRIRWQVMQGVHVPHSQFEVCLCSSVIYPYTFLPSMEQIINKRLHIHTHIIPQISRNYQRQEYVLPLKDNSRGEVEGDNKHGPTTVRGSRHSIRIDSICCQRNTYISSLPASIVLRLSKCFHASPSDGCIIFSGW